MTYGLFINFHVTYRNYTDDSKQIESVFMTLNNTNTGVVYGYDFDNDRLFPQFSFS